MDYQISYACMSHIGRRRRMNQDNFLCGGIYAKPDQPGRGRAPITGSVTSAQVAEALGAQFGCSVDKKDIKLDDSIKQAGSFAFKIKLYPGIDAEMTLKVETE